ncbi:hypothetical protein R1sor_012726 [Riccia sorocarpa]|uniref:LAGLIDADG homing endonuclease n=1 Tax=Riccia sorocarpa TaxID=122646 RepID=A0ABD3I871_9MARC
MTTEVLRELWTDAKEDVVEFVHFSWNTDQLSWKQQSGIIKLIPKDGGHDSGGFFWASPENLNALQSTVKTYEEISGAHLNLEKSIIIPVAMEETPAWLSNTGCYIAKEGEVIKYLGYPIGWKLNDTHRSTFLLGKFEKKLEWWAYKLLTFEGRLIVLKHVLKNIPNHLMVNMPIQDCTLKKLDSSRKFSGL